MSPGDAGSGVPDERAARWVEALWPEGITYAGDITQDSSVRRCMALADAEVAAAVSGCRRDQQERLEAAVEKVKALPNDDPLGWYVVQEEVLDILRGALAGEVNPE